LAKSKKTITTICLLLSENDGLGKIPQQSKKLTKKRNSCQFSSVKPMDLTFPSLLLILSSKAPWGLHRWIKFFKHLRINVGIFLEDFNTKEGPRSIKEDPFQTTHLGLLSKFHSH
jgi:hypothetical protein